MKHREEVLFLCTHNAARSQMAEALLHHIAGDRFEVSSAGLEPTEVHPLTRDVLSERGIDASMLRAKGIREFIGQVRGDYAIVVCEPTEVSCPRVFPFALQTLRWPFPDPGSVAGTLDTQRAAFRRVRDAIERKVQMWVRERSS